MVAAPLAWILEKKCAEKNTAISPYWAYSLKEKQTFAVLSH